MTDFLEQLHSRVVNAGLFKAASIRVAEAAKILDDPFSSGRYDAIVVTLTHSVFRQQFDPATLMSLAHKKAPLIDMRGSFDTPDTRDWFNYWRP